MTSPSRPANPEDLTELADAYIAWDRSCQRISDRAQAAIDQGKRPPRLGELTLAAESDRLITIEKKLRLRLGWDKPVRTLRKTVSLRDAVVRSALRALTPSDHHHDQHDQQDDQ